MVLQANWTSTVDWPHACASFWITAGQARTSLGLIALKKFSWK